MSQGLQVLNQNELQHHIASHRHNPTVEVRVTRALERLTKQVLVLARKDVAKDLFCLYNLRLTLRHFAKIVLEIG